MASIALGVAGVSVHVALAALWVVAPGGPPDSPRPFDLQLPTEACLIASFALALWLLLLGCRTILVPQAGLLHLRRKYGYWIAAQLIVGLAYAALVVVSDRDVWRPPPVSSSIKEATLWFAILASYPLLLIPLVRSRSFDAANQ